MATAKDLEGNNISADNDTQRNFNTTDSSGDKNFFDDLLKDTVTQQVQEPKTIMEQFDERQQLARDAGRAASGLIESEFGRRIETEQELGTRNVTAAAEARRGFASNTALLQQIQEQSDKRIRSLEKDKVDALAKSKFDLSNTLDDLISQEQTAVTDARTRLLNSLFAVSAEERAQRGETRADERIRLERAAGDRAERGFETPEERRAAELEDLQAQELRSLRFEFPEAAQATNLDEALAAIGPRLQEDRRLELAQLNASIRASNAAAARSLADVDKTDPNRQVTEGFLNVETEDAFREEGQAVIESVNNGQISVAQGFDELRISFSESQVSDDALKKELGVTPAGFDDEGSPIPSPVFGTTSKIEQRIESLKGYRGLTKGDIRAILLENGFTWEEIDNSSMTRDFFTKLIDIRI